MQNQIYEIKNIPEYKIGDTISNRLVALVQLEQFADERTMTVKIVEDLMKIALMAKTRKEQRIFEVACLTMKQGLRYVQKNGMVPVTIPQKDLQLLELLKRAANKIDCTEQTLLKRFFSILSDLATQHHHYLVRTYIDSLLRSYHEQGDFSSAFNYRKHSRND